MDNIRYYKGHSKKKEKIMIYKVYDEPQKVLFGLNADSYMVEASALEQTGLTRYSTIEECLKDNDLSREITDTEFKCYVDIQHLLTEMYMHDFTGGFPRKDYIKNIMKRLPGELESWLTNI